MEMANNDIADKFVDAVLKVTLSQQGKYFIDDFEIGCPEMKGRALLIERRAPLDSNPTYGDFFQGAVQRVQHTGFANAFIEGEYQFSAGKVTGTIVPCVVDDVTRARYINHFMDRYRASEAQRTTEKVSRVSV